MQPVQVVNFDTVTCEIIDFIKGGTTYHIRDDFPTEILLPLVPLLVEGFQSRQVIVEAVKSGKPEAEITAAIDDIKQKADKADRLSVSIVGNIFRHSYPELTDDAIAALFTRKERMAIAQLFFYRVGKGLSDVLNATGMSLPTSESPASPVSPTGLPTITDPDTTSLANGSTAVQPS